jgi:type VI secretion system ImpB/VipA family protein
MSTDADPESASNGPSERVGMQITSGPTQTDIEALSSEDPSGDGLPFRLLLVSDLVPETDIDWGERTVRRRIGSATTGADLMAAWSPSLSLEVANTLGETPDTWTVALSFPTPEAFTPRAVARQVDPLDRLLDLRALVTSAANGETSEAAFREDLAALGVDIDWADDLYRLLRGDDPPARPDSSAGASPEATDGEEALGRVLDMVDVEENGSTARSDVSEGLDLSDDDLGDASGMAAALAAAVDRGGANGEAARSLPQRLTAALRAQVRRIIEHPAFRRLEAAWRGLFFLEERLDLDRGVELVVLPAGRNALHEALHHQVLVPEHSDSYDDSPTSLVMVDQAFGRTHADVDQLADLAGTGESLQAPVVASVGAEFFGIEHLRGLQKLPALRPQLQGDEFVEWKRLRQKEASSFLGLALPSVRLRAPYSQPDLESGLGIQEDEGLYGSGALLVGAAAAHSVVETGWPTHLTEPSIQVDPGGAESSRASPLAASFSGSMQSELARAGFVVVESGQEAGSVRVSQAPSVHEPDVYEDPSAAAEARAETALPCRLFAGRAAHRLWAIRRHLDASAPLDDIQKEVAAAMVAFLDVSGEDLSAITGQETIRTPSESQDESGEDEPLPVRVNHVTDAELPDQEVLAVRLRPPEAVLAPTVRLAMTLRVSQSS